MFLEVKTIPVKMLEVCCGSWVSTFQEFVVGVENLLKCGVQENRRAPDTCLVSLFSLVKIYSKHHVSYQWVVTPSRCVTGCLSSVLGSSWELWWPQKLAVRTPERTVSVKASIVQSCTVCLPSAFCPSFPAWVPEPECTNPLTDCSTMTQLKTD